MSECTKLYPDANTYTYSRACVQDNLTKARSNIQRDITVTNATMSGYAQNPLHQRDVHSPRSPRPRSSAVLALDVRVCVFVCVMNCIRIVVAMLISVAGEADVYTRMATYTYQHIQHTYMHTYIHARTSLFSARLWGRSSGLSTRLQNRPLNMQNRSQGQN